MQHKTVTNILSYGNVCVFDIASNYFHVKGTLRTFTLHQTRFMEWLKSVGKILHGDRRVINDLDNVDFISSNVQSSHQEALLYIFEDNEAVIKIIIKVKKPNNETCFQDPQSCSWLVIWSNQFGPKNPNQIHRHQKRTPFQFYSLLWNNGEKTSTRFRREQNRDQWWALLQGCRRTYDPRLQQAWEREVMEVKIPGVQMLRNRKDRRDPMSAATERPHLTTMIMNNLLKPVPQQTIHSGKITMLGLLKSGKLILRCANDRGARCNFLRSDTRIPTWFLSQWNSAWGNRANLGEWGNTSWKIGETWCWSSKRSKATTFCHWKRWNRIGIVCRIKIIRESVEWLSAKKTETNFKCYRRWRENSLMWGMFMTVTMESAVFMGKTYLNNCQSIANTTDLTFKQMFDISTRLVSEQDEISGLETIGWENHSWKYLSMIGDERVINLQRTKVYVFFGFCIVSW